MALPRSVEARPFYRCAKQRYEEGWELLQTSKARDKEDMVNGAMYLAGYGIECMLKALILDNVPAAKRAELVAEFKGRKAHDYGWLRDQYLATKAPRFPVDIVRAFTFCRNTWSTELRYEPERHDRDEADRLFDEVKRFLDWAEGRF